MPLVSEASFKPNRVSYLEIDRPGSGGLNLNDLEYEMENNQSPKMLNMMYRNGVFSKRYGTETHRRFRDDSGNSIAIVAAAEYNGDVYVHARNDDPSYSKIITKDGTTVASVQNWTHGTFFVFNKYLYYILLDSGYTNYKFYQFDGTTWGEVDPYIPIVAINAKPDGTYYDSVEPLNLIGSKYDVHYHGDGSSTVYYLPEKPVNGVTKVVVNGSTVSSSNYSVNTTDGTVTFTNGAPSEGINNVEITVSKVDVAQALMVMKCKYTCAFGGNNNSRLFLAGNGKSQYFYSYAFDATYFPSASYAQIGSSLDDITGLAEQYNVLFVFKPHEIYSLQYYERTEEDDLVVATGAFTSQVVNARIGCDCPNTIQLIDNRLTWLNSEHGVCTVVSTDIKDERNILTISRNIDAKFKTAGLLAEANLQNALSADYDGKYWLYINGKIYVWDYILTPYYFNGMPDESAKRLAWFLFDGDLFSSGYVKCNNTLYFYYGANLNKFNKSFIDIRKVNKEGSPTVDDTKNYAIIAYYQTPMYQFGAVEWLKDVKNVYIQCSTAAKTDIRITYMSDREPSGEIDPEDIAISGRILWGNFHWGNGELIDPDGDPDDLENHATDWTWHVYVLGDTFRRCCRLKHIQMMGLLFENKTRKSDLCISHLAIDYTIAKNVK